MTQNTPIDKKKLFPRSPDKKEHLNTKSDDVVGLAVSAVAPPLLPALELLPALRPLPLEGQRCRFPAARPNGAAKSASSSVIHAGISSWWKA